MTHIQGSQAFQQANLGGDLNANSTTLKDNPLQQCAVYILESAVYALFYLSEPIGTKVEFLQSGPFVDRSTQIQSLYAVLTEHQLSDDAGHPGRRARQDNDAVGSHIYWP